jgi:uncharacterized protein YbjT (DUF2867 family)
MTVLKIIPPQSVALLGGSGFVGRAVSRQLAQAGYQVKVLTRKAYRARQLSVLPEVQVIEISSEASSLPNALKGCSAAINLVGILHESGANQFDQVHAGLAQKLIDACKSSSVNRLIHIGAIGTDAHAPSRYLRSKAASEAVVHASGLDWTILRPSVIFGQEDQFLNLFADLAKIAPVLPLACPNAQFQPIHVEDVARAVVRCLALPETAGKTLELCGPEVYSLKELIRKVQEWIGARPPILGLSPSMSMLQATVMGLLPIKLITPDNVRSMQVPNIASGPFPSVLGFQPAAMETVVPAYLSPQSGRARYGSMRRFAGR